MPRAVRTDAFQFVESIHASVWVDYHVGRLEATAFTVVNDGPPNVYAQIVTQRGQTFGQTFAPETTSISIPRNANIGIVFDNEGMPALTGIVSMTFRDPA